MTTCLVVDDVIVTRFAARSFIEELGMSVVDAEDGDGSLA
ncbi:MAG: response regulator, partial [bacterium]|nr:response regulator [bacterium]